MSDLIQKQQLEVHGYEQQMDQMRIELGKKEAYFKERD